MSGELQAGVVNALSPEQIKAILIRAAWLKNDIIDIKCLAADLRRALQSGLDAGLIDLTSIPEGYYSQNIDEYTSLLVVLGYAKRRSPLSLTNKGHKILKEMVNQAHESHSEIVSQWADALGVTVQDLLEREEPRTS
jgi:hypothetical protein